MVLVITIGLLLPLMSSVTSSSCRPSSAAGHRNSFRCSTTIRTTSSTTSSSVTASFDDVPVNVSALQLAIRVPTGSLPPAVTWSNATLPVTLSRLEVLEVDMTRVTSLHPGAFHAVGATLSQLQLFRDASSPAVDGLLGAGVFNGLSRLQTLVVSLMGLTDLTQGVLDELVNLTVLDLSHNHLTRITHGLFSGGGGAGNRGCSVSLLVLSVARNRFTSLRDLSLSELRVLQRLDAHGNAIGAIRAADFDNGVSSSALLEINLGQNGIRSIDPRAFLKLDRLRTLDLSGNHLAETILNSDTFAGLSALSVLDLSDNIGGAVDAGGFDSGNDPGKDGVRLRLSAGVFGLFGESLRTLILKNNGIESVQENLFVGLVNVEELNLSGNKIRYLDATFLYGLLNVKRLRLDRNGLERIVAGAFEHFALLEELNLSGNRLRTISENAFGLDTSSSGKIIAMSLDLSDNRWECSCELEWLLNRMENVDPQQNNGARTNNVLRLKIEQQTSLICSSPPPAAGKNLLNVLRELTCPSPGEVTMHNLTTTSLDDVLTTRPLKNESSFERLYRNSFDSISITPPRPTTLEYTGTRTMTMFVVMFSLLMTGLVAVVIGLFLLLKRHRRLSRQLYQVEPASVAQTGQGQCRGRLKSGDSVIEMDEDDKRFVDLKSYVITLPPSWTTMSMTSSSSSNCI